ncbi:MAG: hypothetical protein ACI4E1_00140 [Lachnospira sp.]
MAAILELKEKFNRFYNRYNQYIVPAVKFIVALLSFIMLNVSIGYNNTLKNPLIAVVLSVFCAFLPVGGTIIFLSLFMLGHLFSISAEFAILSLGIVVLMYLLYFRFTPKTGYILIVTAMVCWLKIPFIIPVAVGLCFSALSVIPVSFGIVIYYIVSIASEYQAALADESMSESMQEITYLVESLFKNPQMILTIVAFAVTIVVVYFIRRLKLDYSWIYAIISGTVVQFLILVIGQFAFNAKFNIILVIVGVLLGAAVGYLCNVLFFALDYKRTEYVQYEDDEYYYYVKAVPKIIVAGSDVKVKQINARKTKKASDISDVRATRHREQNAQSNEDDDDMFF